MQAIFDEEQYYQNYMIEMLCSSKLLFVTLKQVLKRFIQPNRCKSAGRLTIDFNFKRRMGESILASRDESGTLNERRATLAKTEIFLQGEFRWMFLHR